MQRKDFDKKIIQLHKEQRSIRKEISNLGYEELDPPIQRGWKRHFVLGKDLKSKDAKFFQGLLDKINTTQYSWKKDFKVKRRQRGKKIYVVREQYLELLWPDFFHKKKFTEREAKYFELVITRERIGNNFLWIYRFTEPWRFKLKIEPNIIRRTKIKNYDLEKRKNEIDQYLERNNLYPKMHKLVHGGYQWRLRYAYHGDIVKYKYNPFKNRSFADILDEHMPEPTMRISKNPRKPGGFLLQLFDILSFESWGLRMEIWEKGNSITGCMSLAN